MVHLKICLQKKGSKKKKMIIYEIYNLVIVNTKRLSHF